MEFNTYDYLIFSNLSLPQEWHNIAYDKPVVHLCTLSIHAANEIEPISPFSSPHQVWFGE